MQDVLNIGIDVAKAELVIGVADHPEHTLTLANTAAQIARWLDGVPPGSRIAVESTGPYHALLVNQAQARGFAVYVLNARDVYFYAKALGQRGKTDRTDAQLISRYLREHHARLHAFVAGTPAQQSVNQLLQRRERVVVHKDGLVRSLRGISELQAGVQAMVQQLDALLAEIDRRIADLIARQAELTRTARHLSSIPGVGPQGAALLTCLLHRIGFANADALVAFSGLDPRPMDSGQKRGRRRLSKRGSPLLRRQVFMMAFAGCKTKAFKPFYLALKAKGFSSTEAFVILGRKLLRIAFAVWRTQAPFDLQRFTSKGACAEL